MKKGYIFLSVAILSIVMAGCGGPRRKVKVDTTPTNTDMDVQANIDIPMAEDGIKSFFDEDINEFALVEDAKTSDMKNEIAAGAGAQELAWEDAPMESEFKTVYFDFDNYTIRDDQQENLRCNIELVKKAIDESKFFGNPAPTVVIDGHACHSAGSRVYNLALSERRAKVLADKFVEAGVARENIKIVGRGSEMPAMINGKACEGDREQQWPNRRDELRIVYS